MQEQVTQEGTESIEEQATQEVQPRPEYDLHIKVPNEMREKLKDAADLAYKLGVIAKPDLVDLMNLFIGWGMTVLKRQWLDRIGYR